MGRRNTSESGPDPVDIHVGGRVRALRIASGLSQAALGERIGLTFQQVQKYERGTNRISASALFGIGRVLHVPVAYFFDQMPDEIAGSDAVPDVAAPGLSRVHLELIRDFNRIPEGPAREHARKLIRACADIVGKPDPVTD